MKNKWWKQGKCVREESSKEDANELGVENIGGIFLVLIAGLIIGILVAIGEFVWKSKQNAEIDRVNIFFFCSISSVYAYSGLSRGGIDCAVWLKNFTSINT